MCKNNTLHTVCDDSCGIEKDFHKNLHQSMLISPRAHGTTCSPVTQESYFYGVHPRSPMKGNVGDYHKTATTAQKRVLRVEQTSVHDHKSTWQHSGAASKTGAWWMTSQRREYHQQVSDSAATFSCHTSLLSSGGFPLQRRRRKRARNIIRG